MSFENNNFSILGVFWDGYEDIWLDFVSLLKKNWQDCPFEIYIVNNGTCPKNPMFDGIHFIDAGVHAEYSKKIQVALEQINSDYILVLLEDFFIFNVIDTARIKEMLDFISLNNIDYYCMPMYEFLSFKEKKLFDEKNRCVYRMSGKQDYTLVCQPSIWKREFLKLCIGFENYNAWVFEGIYKLPFIKNKKYLSKCVVDYSNPLNLLHGALQGKIVRRTSRILKKHGYVILSNREMISWPKTAKNFMRRFLEKVLIVFHLTKLKKLNKKSIIKKYENVISDVASKVLSKERFDNYFKK